MLSLLPGQSWKEDRYSAERFPAKLVTEKQFEEVYQNTVAGYAGRETPAMSSARALVLLTIEEFCLSLRFKRRHLFSTVTTFASNLIVMAGIILVSMPSIAYGHDVKVVLQLSNAGCLIGFLY